jgi:succinoglycan biosynthesis transport protein ExoP
MTDQRFKGNEFSKDISLRQLVEPLFRRKKLLVATFLSLLLVLILVGVFYPAPYKSHMAVLVNRERLDPLVTTEPTNQVPSQGAAAVTVEEINSEAELLLSQDLLRKVVLATGLENAPSVLDWLPPAKTQDQKIEKAVKKLAKKLTIKNETNSNLIDISYSSPDPQLAYAVLSNLGDFYVQKHAEVHRPPGSFLFFDKETQKYHDALQQSESKLKNFSREQGVAAPDVERTDLALTVATSIGQLFTAQQAIASDGERIRSDEAQLLNTPKRTPTLQGSVQADKLLEDLGASLLAAQSKRTQLGLKYDPSYPLVREADEEVAQTKAAIAEAEKTRYVTQTTDVDPTYELLREDLAKTQADLAAQRAAATAAKRGIDSLQARMVDLDGKALTQQDLLRDAKANEDNYLLYLAKREQERTSDALDKTRIGNVAIAVPPAIPALPLYSIPIMVLVAFGASIVLSIGLAYTVDYFDPSFHTPAQVIDMLGIPVVIAVSKKTA